MSEFGFNVKRFFLVQVQFRVSFDYHRALGRSRNSNIEKASRGGRGVGQVHHPGRCPVLELYVCWCIDSRLVLFQYTGMF